MVARELGGTVREAVSGHPDAWDQLVERFSGLVWGVARSQMLNAADASDVSQTVWLRLAEHIGKLRDPERVGAWLAVTARNEAQRVQKRRQFQVPVSHERLLRLPEANPRQPEAAVVAEEESAALWKAFSRLGEACQSLLRMLISDPPASYSVVSETLGLPIGSIGPTRSRCLQHLRQEIESDDHASLCLERDGVK
ncbi:MAG TPA: sigma-70 family RNA polymerase sigma factor [Acidimicrobiales bacterium]|jgi:RNA polymerase sigma factor (sigma-70 family)